LNVLLEFFRFVKARKKLWLLPLLLAMLILGFVIALAPGSAIAPFIYALF
jgi:hypothetical protein